ncbi:MAG TPA: hypothetical protein VG722_06985 [Tepidisphaeraceae bacterium]|nr:hypothetical protein [Tepidisphaeraceae bacterium]
MIEKTVIKRKHIRQRTPARPAQSQADALSIQQQSGRESSKEKESAEARRKAG